MDIKNSLVPAEFAENYQKTSKWSQPGGGLAKILTIIAGCAGVYALYLALPVILSMMTNAFNIALLAIGLWALVSIVTNKKFRRMLSTAFFIICRKLTSMFVEIDPAAIIDRHVSELKERINKIVEAMGKFRGAIRAVEDEKARRERELKKEMELLKAYKDKNMMAESTVHSNQANRLTELISLLSSDLDKMNTYYNLLRDLQNYTKLKAEDEENQSNMLKARFKRTRDMYSAFSGMMSVVNSETSDIEEYMMASDYMMSQINQQMGAIDDALLNTDSIINDIAVNNSVNISKAGGLLDIYEKFGIDGLFMTEEQRKALPSSATGTVSVSQLGITETDRELQYAAQKRADILGESNSGRKYV